MRLKKEDPEVSVLIAFGLGMVFGIGALLVTTQRQGWLDVGLFCMLLAVYHLWEWLFVAHFRRAELTADAFLINHSPEWAAAWLFCIAEYAVERFLWPGLKGHTLPILVSFAIAALGQALRTTAMATAGSNFAHMIEDEKRADHRLVITGVYSLSRHPAYCGWFWWTVALQVMLANPVSTLAFAAVAWRFFRDRIRYEELTLVEQFGPAYTTYRSKVSVGIPFLH